MDFVALELIRALQSIDAVNEYYILVAEGEDKCFVSKNNFQVVEISCSNYLLWEQIALPLALRKIAPDIVHCTSNTAPLYCPYPLVLTLHDIIFLEQKIGANKSLYQNLGRIYRRFVVPKVVRKAGKIITVSDFEQGQIRKGLPMSSDRIVTVYNGVGHQFRLIADDEKICRKYISQKGYIFLLGNTDPKKNIYRALSAYAMYARRTANPRPLLVADLSSECLNDMLNKGNVNDISPLIHITGYIANSDLPIIYNDAHVFLYPSLRESFGLPVLEAMACGTPVVTSTTSALPEIAGVGAALVNPESTEDIANMLIRLDTDKEYYNSLTEYGIDRAKLFSWERTASQIKQHYDEILKR